MKKLNLFFFLTLFFCGLVAKLRNCSGCKWCIERTTNKKEKKQADHAPNCRWCIKKEKRSERKEKRIEKKKDAKKEPVKEEEKVDPNLLAQQLINAIKTDKPLEVMEELIDQGANLDYEDKEKRTPLHWAAVYAQPYTVGLLMVHRADVEAEDYRGNTPLHLAVKYRPHASKRKEVIRHLIFEGASIYKRNDQGLNVLESAIDMGIRRFVLLTALKPTFISGQITF